MVQQAKPIKLAIKIDLAEMNIEDLAVLSAFERGERVDEFLELLDRVVTAKEEETDKVMEVGKLPVVYLAEISKALMEAMQEAANPTPPKSKAKS